MWRRSASLGTVQIILSTCQDCLQKIAARFPDCDNSYNQIHENRLISSFNPLRIASDLRFSLAKVGEIFDERKLVFLKHHLCHAASSFLCSGFDEASILILDGSGEELTTSLWHGVVRISALLGGLSYRIRSVVITQLSLNTWALNLIRKRGSSWGSRPMGPTAKTPRENSIRSLTTTVILGIFTYP